MEFSMLSARVLGAVAVVVSSLSAGIASADTLSLSGIGTPGVLTTAFNPTGLAAMNLDGIGVGTPITIFSGTSNTGGLSISPTAGATFTFMGKEASYTNQLLLGNTVLFDNNVAPGTPSATLTISAGLVPFLFRAVSPGNKDANNGGAMAPNLKIAFAKVSDTVFYAFFEDGGGGSIDFDDMVVKIVDPPLATPLPGALPLFATGLGALGLLSWRRKRKAQAAG